MKKRNLFLITLLMFSCSFIYADKNTKETASTKNDISTKFGDKKFRSFTLYEQNLIQARTLANNSDSIQMKLKEVYKKADKMLLEPDVAVTQKSAEAAVYVNGDMHAYCSLSKYFWPDSLDARKPWIRRDGKTNEVGVIKFDSRRMYKMADRVWNFTLAWWFSDKAEYAKAAISQLRVWYINEATKMNPDMEFAQFVPNDPKLGRGAYYGIIEANSYPSVLNAVAMLETSKYWEKSDDAALKTWFGQFSNWLLQSDNGKKESQMTNNHGVYYDILLSSCLLYTGEKQKAFDVLSKVPSFRMATQIEPDGSMPKELGRANPWGYTAMNLRGFVNLCVLGEKVGLNLWETKAPQTVGLKTAIEFVNPYILGTKKWEYKEKVNAADVYEVYLYTQDKYPDSKKMLNGLSALKDKNFLNNLFYSGFQK